MEVIYIDRLFFLNLIIDYLLIMGSAGVCGIVLHRARYLIAALLGAVYAALSVLPRLSFLSLMPFKLCSGILMGLIAYGNEKKLLRCVLVFFSVSALFGGVIWALSLRSGPTGGTAYIPLSMPALIFAFGICYALLSFVFRRTAKGAEKKIYNTELEFMGSTVRLRTLCDSGNTLYDPISGARVLVTSPAPLLALFPDAERSSSELVLSHPGVFRLVPYSAVGAGGMLAAFRPAELKLDGIPQSDILVALSPSPICGDGFDSVLGM